MIIGYARVSTDDQSLDAQTDALTAAGANKLFADRISGSKRERPELDRMLDQLRDGDIVTVTKYDRLARSLKDLLEIVAAIRAKGAGFRSLAEDIDTTMDGCRAKRQSSSGSNVCRRNATTIASSASVRVVERGSFGPVFRSSTVARLRHFATVLGLMPNSRLSVASEACDRCIAALTACVVVALP